MGRRAAGGADPRDVGRCFRRALNTPAAFRVLGDLTSFMSGGCWVAARAFQRTYGGQLVAVASPNNAVEHVAVRKDGLFYDADGAQTEAQLLRKMRTREFVPDPRVAPYRRAGEISHDARKAAAVAAILRKSCPR